MKWNFGHIDFSTYPASTDRSLGMLCNRQQSSLHLWAPTASAVIFRKYGQGSGGDILLEQPMSHVGQGIWSMELAGNHHGFYYTVQCLIDGKWMDEVPDPYAFAVGVNGKRAMFCNFSQTNPAGWDNDRRVLPEHYTDMVIYELHVRDFSIDPGSGISNKGKFLAFTEKGTHSPEGLKTGPDHLLEMGITHVQLLPIFDFLTVDESKQPPTDYNWGYDPLNFNAPEGSYSTDPFNGSIRITELKHAIKALHENGIRCDHGCCVQPYRPYQPFLFQPDSTRLLLPATPQRKLQRCQRLRHRNRLGTHNGTKVHHRFIEVLGHRIPYRWFPVRPDGHFRH
jgi:pullulanase